MWPIDVVKPYGRNPRKNDAAVPIVARSLQEFGWQQPIVVDKKGVVIVGHTRLKAARLLGLSEVPVHVASELSAKKVRAYRIADNRVGEEAKWEMPDLAAEIRDLGTGSFIGFDATEIKDILSGVALPSLEFIGSGEVEAASMPQEFGDRDKGPADRYPLSIVLTIPEYRRWTALKERLATKGDKAAFLMVLDAMEASC